MIKRFCLICVSLFYITSSFSQIKKTIPAKPKIVIGLVIDQMRWDYLYRYSELYSSGGFKRLLNQGFSCENTFINFVPTYTAPGHTCIYTGSVPAINGIVGNNWFNRSTGKNMYCTQDTSVNTIGSNSFAGKMSPKNLWTTTITDELRISNNFKSKVIALALKDRASITPGGHTANAAYWFDDSNGKWITSSYYMNQLPDWVNAFNNKRLPDDYMSKDWNALMPLSKYDLSTADNKEYESNIPGENNRSFPHRLSEIKHKYLAFNYTPFANTFTFDFAKATIENEKMGQNTVPDFLAVSISSTDYIGHQFGPNSIEIQDTYLRLDNDISEFLKYLDSKFGKENYLLFLSADHAVANIPAFLQEHKIPSGTYSQTNLTKNINLLLEEKFLIKKGVLNIQNYQIYLNTKEIEKENKNLSEIKKAVIDFLNQQEFISSAIDLEKITSSSLPDVIKQKIINGYNFKRSGDIHFIYKPGYFDPGGNSTTHGSLNPYDSHIPLIWFGWNIKHGSSNREIYMTDIAPTLAALLKIQMPNGSIGKVIEEVVK